jgi:hypothetical protein
LLARGAPSSAQCLAQAVAIASGGSRAAAVASVLGDADDDEVAAGGPRVCRARGLARVMSKLALQTLGWQDLLVWMVPAHGIVVAVPLCHGPWVLASDTRPRALAVPLEHSSSPGRLRVAAGTDRRASRSRVSLGAWSSARCSGVPAALAAASRRATTGSRRGRTRSSGTCSGSGTRLAPRGTRRRSSSSASIRRSSS